MKKLILIILGVCVWGMCAQAETIILRTGARVEGTIVFQNEDVIIIRNAEGARFQYPKAEVVKISEEGAEMSDEVSAMMDERLGNSDEPLASKKASILLEVGGGAASRPGETMGGAGSVDLMVGSHHIGGRRVFVGGGVGYHGLFVDGEKFHFLPIQAAVRMPLIEGKHAPVFGIGVGYGVALSKTYRGGLYAGVDVGYRYQVNPKTAIGAVMYCQFQQATIRVEETVEEHIFTNNTGRSLIAFGAKFTFYF